LPLHAFRSATRTAKSQRYIWTAGHFSVEAACLKATRRGLRYASSNSGLLLARLAPPRVLSERRNCKQQTEKQDDRTLQEFRVRILRSGPLKNVKLLLNLVPGFGFRNRRPGVDFHPPQELLAERKSFLIFGLTTRSMTHQP
jgi:hypothetical protein